MATTFLSPRPQPGDGAWLLQQSSSKRRRPRKNVKSFLRPNPDNVQGAPDPALKPELGTLYLGKERSTSRPAPDPLVPQRIANESLLSHNPNELAPSARPPLATFLRQPDQLTYKFQHKEHSSQRNKDEEMTTPTRIKAIPPHLRKKNVTPASAVEVPSPVATQESQLSKNDSVQDNQWTADAKPPINNLVDKSTTKTSTWSHVVNGVQKQSTNQPLVTSSSHEADQTAINGFSAAKPLKSFTADSKRGWRAPRRGRGGKGGREPRDARWPKAAETKPDPKRWDIRWDSDEKGSLSSVDSVCANAGFGDKKRKKKQVENGVDLETGFKLTDWDGNWAPAPVDWDSRPAFRDGQSYAKIMQWLTEIEEAMQGVRWAIPTEDVTLDGVTYHFHPNPKNLKLSFMGDLAPRYWIPVTFGGRKDGTIGQAPQTFWNELLRSEEPKPYDEDDLLDIRPWWQMYQAPGCYFLKSYEPPNIIGIDPDEDQDQRIAREQDHGSNYHAANRKRTEKAKKAAKEERRKQEEERVRKFPQSVVAVRSYKIKPGIKLYIRSAKPEDVPRIREIYNYYIDNTVCTPETSRRTNEDMMHRLNDIRSSRMPFLVACEPGAKVPVCRKKDKREEMILPDKVVGFAMADDYNDMQGMYRFTAEVEVFVDKDYYMKGIAKCLLDKLMSLLDPIYVDKGGYDVVGEDLDGSGAMRRISNIIVNLPYDKSKHERLEWIEKWLHNWMDFEKVGELKGIGLKDGKSVNLAIFQRKTGEEIDPQQPPVMMSYPARGA